MEQYSWDRVPIEQMNAFINRQVIHTPYLTMVRIHFKRGALVPAHQHIHEQLTSVVSGRLKIEMDGDSTVLGPGDVARLPPNVPHAAEALDDTLVIDVFTPARTDWQ